MICSINNFGGFNQQVRQNPDEYAKIYAEQNGISVEDAKTKLKEQYDDPAQDASGSIFNFNADSNINNMDFSNIYDSPELKLNSNKQNGISSILQKFLDFLNGSDSTNKNNSNYNTIKPQKPIFSQKGSKEESGIKRQHKEGFPQFQLGQFGEMNGPQKPGDPQPHLGQLRGINGPQKPGDPQPHLEQNGLNPFEQPSEPEKPSEPQRPDSPQKPSEPEKPSEPQRPDAPQKPSEPEKPSEPQRPDGPQKPSEPEKPSEPQRPDGPQKPSEPEKPSEPQRPDGPQKPSEPQRPPRAFINQLSTSEKKAIYLKK